MSQEVKSYRFINRRLVESLARTLDLPLNQTRADEREFSLTKLLGIRFKHTRTQEVLTSGDPRLIPPIVEALRNSGQLRGFRPEVSMDFWHGDRDAWYVFEDMIATPVFIPLDGKTPPGTKWPAALNVWISNPVALSSERDEWDFAGSLVYLIEEVGDFAWPYSSFMSGISALRLVANMAEHPERLASKKYVAGDADRFLPELGDEDPISYLEMIGGSAGLPRRLEVVYKIAYMSNECWYQIDGKSQRVNDLIAYPLYMVDL